MSADKALYEAKGAGRNQVVFSSFCNAVFPLRPADDANKTKMVVARDVG